MPSRIGKRRGRREEIFELILKKDKKYSILKKGPPRKTIFSLDAVKESIMSCPQGAFIVFHKIQPVHGQKMIIGFGKERINRDYLMEITAKTLLKELGSGKNIDKKVLASTMKRIKVAFAELTGYTTREIQKVEGAPQLGSKGTVILEMVEGINSQPERIVLSGIALPTVKIENLEKARIYIYNKLLNRVYRSYGKQNKATVFQVSVSPNDAALKTFLRLNGFKQTRMEKNTGQLVFELDFRYYEPKTTF